MPGSRILVTGGAGFIGRWVVAELLGRTEPEHGVVVLDNLSNGSPENLEEFRDHPRFVEFVQGDIRDTATMRALFARHEFSTVFHLAARINVQDSIDNPRDVFDADVAGTFELLELCREFSARFVFTSTCMVYDRCISPDGIRESDPVKPASPYAGAKLAGEDLALSYFHAYGLPVVVLRPFNTYGPFQKSSGEGGVIAIFCKAALGGSELRIYGDGTQTRDFLYVEDCARFIVLAGFDPRAEGRVLNAGSGADVTINELADLVSAGRASIVHVPHIHPQSEIMKLRCDASFVRSLLGFTPCVDLAEGIVRTSEWIAARLARTS
ncbi:MAG: NAD-dependent epimerase/dehydratase family protein [Deltaproteobacteria bacterium]|nr:NAD-dependent epimerase/dehydratase family protein [Deltaproteobacteria bacterium]